MTKYKHDGAGSRFYCALSAELIVSFHDVNKSGSAARFATFGDPNITIFCAPI